MPWIISSQTIPILALAPILVVVAFNCHRPSAFTTAPHRRKALISTYLSFFPVTVGMVKGLRSPSPIHLDLMRTYNATDGADAYGSCGCRRRCRSCSPR